MMKADQMAEMLKTFLLGWTQGFDEYIVEHPELDHVVETATVETKYIGTRQVELIAKVDVGDGKEFEQFRILVTKED